MASESLYTHAAFYRMLHDDRSSDLPFYLDGTADRPRVLEYGIGTGRVALPMARRGQHVVGVDDSAAMLDGLRRELRAEPPEVGARLRLVHADARRLELPERFDAITCPYNGISHHHDHEQLGAFLGKVRQHLRPDGLFLFDVAIPDPNLLRGCTSEVPWFRDPVDGSVCRATERIEYEPLGQILTITISQRRMQGSAADDDPPVEPVEMVLRLRQLFPEETRLLLAHHGFSVVHRETGLGDVLGYVCRAE